MASALLALFAGVMMVTPGWCASIVIVNNDPPGVGFNDTTPASPVGGNTGTTLGQQRINVFQAAAAIWGSKLVSPIPIKIKANFSPLTPCNVNSGTIGAARPADWSRDFPNVPRAGTWYPVALANALANTDETNGDVEIVAQFNGSIGTSNCLPSVRWYLGLDGNRGQNNLDLETTLLHEFAHGLGFAGLVNLSTGQLFAGFPDIFSVFQFDATAGLHWNQMSNGQRLASVTNNGNVVWDGPAVTAASSILTAGKDSAGHEKLYHPTTLIQGSSVYHVDISATPNQLMEYADNDDLTHNVDVPNDLVMKAMLDMGWQQLSTSSTCLPDTNTACLLNNRFKATVKYRGAFDNNPADTPSILKSVTGFATANFETAFFYFNSPNNIEMFLKMLDQGNTNSAGQPTIAVLFGSATPLRLELTITDTKTGAVKTYRSDFNTQSGNTDFTAGIL